MADKGLSQGSGSKKDEPATTTSQVGKSKDSHLPEEERGVGRASAPAKPKPVEAKPVEAAPVEAKPKTLAIHTVKSGDTLSHMALQYYGAATREKWMQIYEANKEQLGEYPGLIRPGDKLIIPELETK